LDQLGRGGGATFSGVMDVDAERGTGLEDGFGVDVVALDEEDDGE